MVGIAVSGLSDLGSRSQATRVPLCKRSRLYRRSGPEAGPDGARHPAAKSAAASLAAAAPRTHGSYRLLLDEGPPERKLSRLAGSEIGVLRRAPARWRCAAPAYHPAPRSASSPAKRAADRSAVADTWPASPVAAGVRCQSGWAPPAGCAGCPASAAASPHRYQSGHPGSPDDSARSAFAQGQRAGWFPSWQSGCTQSVPSGCRHLQYGRPAGTAGQYANNLAKILARRPTRMPKISWLEPRSRSRPGHRATHESPWYTQPDGARAVV